MGGRAQTPGPEARCQEKKEKQTRSWNEVWDQGRLSFVDSSYPLTPMVLNRRGWRCIMQMERHPERSRGRRMGEQSPCRVWGAGTKDSRDSL